MPDYKAMYMKLMYETYRAMDIIETAQRECEEIYMKTQEPPIDVSFGDKKKKGRRRKKADVPSD